MKQTSEAKKPFVVLSQARSGTNFLLSHLSNAEHLLIGWEPFNTPFFGWSVGPGHRIPADIEKKINSPEFRDMDLNFYLEFCAGFTGAFRGSNVLSAGFKIFPQHNAEVYWRMSEDPRFNCLLLSRKSILASYSSLLIALESSQWVRLRGSPQDENGRHKAVFNPELFEHYRSTYLECLDKTRSNLVKNKVSFLELTYEGITSSELDIYNIFDFIGVKAPSFSSTNLVKQGPVDVLENFVNPTDVRPYLDEEQS